MAAASAHSGIPQIQVRDNHELAQRLHEQQPTDVLIETPDDLHPEHIRIALEAGCRRVWSEKCIAARSAQAAPLVSLCTQAAPAQEVWIIDHYLLFDLVLCLVARAGPWLGEVRRLKVTLFESEGVPPAQEQSHAMGMANFFHHPVALAGLFFDLDDLVPVEATWAMHPAARVPDTYRTARFQSKRTGVVVLEAAVGKYMASPTKQIWLQGTEGEAFLDRGRQELRITRSGLPGITIVRSEADTGYGELARAIATGSLPSTLLSVEQAVKVLRLIEEAHRTAQEVPVYSEEHDSEFVSDWQLKWIKPRKQAT